MAIRDRLGKLPANLKAAYDEIYQKIATRNVHDKAVADRAFQWVMCALEPLTTTELLEAVAHDPGSHVLSPLSDLDEDMLLELCCNLLVLDSELDVWRFSHLSVTEYLEDNHFTLEDAHANAAKVCLSVLLAAEICPTISRRGRYETSEPQIETRKSKCCQYTTMGTDRNKFREYVNYSWPIHVRTQERVASKNEDLGRRLKQFLGAPKETSLWYQHWAHLARGDSGRVHPNLHKDNYRFGVDIEPATSTVLGMCILGFYETLRDWWTDPQIGLAHSTNSSGTPLLTLAIVYGHHDIWSFLIKSNANVNAEDKVYGSALVAAASSTALGSIEATEALLAAGAAANLHPAPGHDYSFQTALCCAASTGSSEVMMLLLKYGAEVDYSGSQMGPALSCAVDAGELRAMQVLIDAGANVDLQLQGRYGSALGIAAFLGRMDAMQKLIDAGANVDLQLQGDYGSALGIAAAFGELGAMQKLIEAGANVDLQLQGDYGSALAAAARYRKLGAMRKLIDAGANVNLDIDGKFGSPLAVASWSMDRKAFRREKWDTAVKLLLRAGSEVNKPLKGDYGSALAAAASGGHTIHIEKLLAAGADVNMHLFGNYGSALVAAIDPHPEDIGQISQPNWKTASVKLLLKAGADVRAPLTGRFKNALEAAEHVGDHDVIQLLKEHVEVTPTHPHLPLYC